MIRYIQNRNVMQSAIGDEVVMLEPETGYYFGLNSVAAVIWDELKNPKNIEELVEVLLTRFEIDRGTCLEQTRELVSTMLDKGVICSSN
ncbi:MAG: PqqD family protein [Chitinophagaceae bacterium]|jgi:hypothetical protein